MPDENGLSKLNKYMGGWQDAEEFTTPIGESDHAETIEIPNTLRRAQSLMGQLNALRKAYELSFDQAIQVWIAANIGDPHSYPPITERRKGE